MHAAIYPEVPDDFGNWLAGFADGEGSFSIVPQKRTHTFVCRFQIKVRADDREIMDTIIRTTGLGHLVHIGARTSAQGLNSKPMVDWRVTTRADCSRLVEVFDRHPLRAKKATDFGVWRMAVRAWLQSRGSGGTSIGRNRDVWHTMSLLRRKLQMGRSYDVPTDLVELVDDPTLF